MEAISLWMCAGTAIVSTAKVTLCVANQSFISLLFRLKQPPPPSQSTQAQSNRCLWLHCVQSSFKVKLEKRVCASLLGCFSGWSLKGVVSPVFLPTTAGSCFPSPHTYAPKSGHLIGQSGGDWLVGCFSGYFVLFFKLSAQQGEKGRSVSLRLAWSM